MASLTRLSLITLLNSMSDGLLWRGLYFFTHDHPELRFSDVQNLLLAFSQGAVFTASALFAHRPARVLGERRLLVIALTGQLLCLCPMVIWPSQVPLLVTGAVAKSCLAGFTWPVIESLVCAGRSPTGAARAIGWFNVSWATGLPLSTALAGIVIESSTSGLFVCCAGFTLAGLLSAWPLSDPTHLPEHHPHRPDAQQLAHLRTLLIASRSLLFLGYLMLPILAALMPSVFEELGFSVAIATVLLAIMDLVRLITFVVMQNTARWHGHPSLLVMMAAVLPVGFFATLLGPAVAIVIIGEILFGVSEGVIYYSALYYAMVVENASVDAGGIHESLIGLGGLIGPLLGLGGEYLGTWTGSTAVGMGLGIGPVAVACGGVVIWSVCRLHRHRQRE